MTVYAWPGWPATRFELRVIPNLRTFAGPYTPTTQVLDLLGERWAARIDLPPTNSSIEAAAREAYFDRLKGMSHQISVWHLKLTAPQGTMRSDTAAVSVVNGSGVPVSVVNGSSAAVSVVIGGAPVLVAAVAQLANTASLRTLAGRTLRAGDMLGVAGQLVRVMADSTADGNGLLTFEFQPRARTAWPAYSTVVWARPTANFMLKAADGVSTAWVPGFAQGASFELIEVP
jgi:hypothetical protein